MNLRTSGPLGGLLVVGLFAVVGGGCNKSKLIPNTKIGDSKLNREILLVVERYRRAMEHRDAAAVLALVHPTYRDNGGTPEADDDLDYGGVKKVLANRFKRASQVRLRIEYQNLKTRGREAQVDTWLDATFVYEQPDSPPRWRRFTDYNRFMLLKDGETWRFIGGI